MPWLTLLPLLLATGPTPSPTVWPTPSCVACEVDAQSIRTDYTTKNWRDLALGKIITTKVDEARSDDGIKTAVQTSVIIARTPAEVWSVLVDFEASPSFVASLKEAHIQKVAGNRVWLDERLRIWWTDIHFHIISTLQPKRGLLSWVLDKTQDNDITESIGSWQLVPLPPGPQTLVRYRAHVDTGKPVPGFIERFLVDRSLPKIVGGLRTEVERRFPQ